MTLTDVKLTSPAITLRPRAHADRRAINLSELRRTQRTPARDWYRCTHDETGETRPLENNEKRNYEK